MKSRTTIVTNKQDRECLQVHAWLALIIIYVNDKIFEKIFNIHINNIKANQDSSTNLKAYSLSCL